MQIALGRKGDYAVRAMIEIARYHGRGRRKARQVAAAMDIPERYLPQILALLVRQDLLVATAGPDGGYALARPPGEITLLEVMEVAEGPISADHCLLRGGPCSWEHVCPAHETWDAAQRALATRLGQTTFEDLARQDAKIEAGKIPPPPTPHHPVTVPRLGRREPL